MTAKIEEISLQDAVRKIFESKGRVFSVVFRKRTDGTLRKMNARIGVRKGVKGVGMAYDATQAGLITVHTMAGDQDDDGGGHRNIPADGIRWLKIGGVEYFVEA
jgi:hypothetical protein